MFSHEDRLWKFLTLLVLCPYNKTQNGSLQKMLSHSYLVKDINHKDRHRHLFYFYLNVYNHLSIFCCRAKLLSEVGSSTFPLLLKPHLQHSIYHFQFQFCKSRARVKTLEVRYLNKSQNVRFYKSLFPLTVYCCCSYTSFDIVFFLNHLIFTGSFQIQIKFCRNNNIVHTSSIYIIFNYYIMAQLA